jgi:hypothetical protein
MGDILSGVVDLRKWRLGYRLAQKRAQMFPALADTVL